MLAPGPNILTALTLEGVYGNSGTVVVGASVDGAAELASVGLRDEPELPKSPPRGAPRARAPAPGRPGPAGGPGASLAVGLGGQGPRVDVKVGRCGCNK